MRIQTFTLGPFQTNTYLVEDESTGEAMLIDPTIDSESVYDDIVARKLHLCLILNTHGHLDHTHGDAFFKAQTGAPLAIHADDVPLLRGIGQQSLMFGVEAPATAEADRLLADGDKVQVGGVSFEVIHTPGHTPGGICLYGYSILISGDTLFAGSIGRTDLPGGNYETLLDSIKRRLLVLPVKTVVYSGHGEVTTIGEEKETNPFLE